MLTVGCGSQAAVRVPGSDPTFHAGSKADVFQTVIEAISTRPGLNNSNGWIITNSDSAGGFMKAETSRRTNDLRAGYQTKTDRLSAVVSDAGDQRTQVVLQGTTDADELARRVIKMLEERHGRPQRVSITVPDGTNA